MLRLDRRPQVARIAGETLIAARDRALAHLVSLQSPRGDWEGEMIWCPMITAQYVIVRHVVGRPVEASARPALVRYLEVTRTAEGGWGLHRESGSYVFVTTLVYVALRLLGVGRDEPLLHDARRWLQRQPGGVLAIPSWGKFWLALLDLYDWRAVRPIPPELYLLPRTLPFHPARYYCHTRYIYLAMAYLFGRRVRADLGPLAVALREELYATPYAAIDWSAHRHDVAASDIFVPPGRAVRALSGALGLWERVCPRALRGRALGYCLQRIVDEQRASAYQALSPVNGLLNCLALWAADPAHPDLAPSLDGLESWRWEDARQGRRYAGARSNAWDTAFAIRALLAALATADAPPAARQPLSRAYAFLRDTQLTEELPAGAHEGRDAIRGGWCFSDGVHRWPVSDCTAEAVSALLAAHAVEGAAPAAPERIGTARLQHAALFLLARQNADGGFATYERRRAGAWLETLNPSEMFGQCMTERSYVECTASCVEALAHLRRAVPSLDTPVLARAVARGVTFLRASQRPDGSFLGSWGINFTYAIFHVVKGLRAAGVAASDAVLASAAAWLASVQRPDGGWGEHHRSCLEERYVEHPESQPVMTAWALLALMEILPPDAEPITRGVAWLIARQQPDGGWTGGAVNGVFFGSAMLDYCLYRSYFPTWALARYATLSGGPAFGASAPVFTSRP